MNSDGFDITEVSDLTENRDEIEEKPPNSGSDFIWMFILTYSLCFFRTYGSQWCIHPEKIAFEIKSGYNRFFEFHYLIQMQKLLIVFCLRSQWNPCPSTADCVVSMDYEVRQDSWVTEDYWSLLNLTLGFQRTLARLWEPPGDFLSLIFLSYDELRQHDAVVQLNKVFAKL